MKTSKVKKTCKAMHIMTRCLIIKQPRLTKTIQNMKKIAKWRFRWLLNLKVDCLKYCIRFIYSNWYSNNQVHIAISVFIVLIYLTEVVSDLVEFDNIMSYTKHFYIECRNKHLLYFTGNYYWLNHSITSRQIIQNPNGRTVLKFHPSDPQPSYS